MIKTNAVFVRKESNFEPSSCEVEKVIRLTSTEYDRFVQNMLRDQDFIKDNVNLMYHKDGVCHCLLVTGEGRRDGILVDSSGFDYARYAAFIPNAEDFLTVGRYPALAELNKKLTGIVDFISQKSERQYSFDLNGFEPIAGINLEFNDAILNTVLSMLEERPEIDYCELDNNELIVTYKKNEPEKAEDLADPSVTKTDMYAYGYSWEGMIPLGMERALELFDNGREVFRLYDNGSEGVVGSREEIENFDGIFGAEDPAWVSSEKEPPLQVFILNREKYDKGEAAGEWLALPVLPGDLCSLFERIGIDRPSEGAFTITAVRVRDECVRDYISKYDSLDELNMLASYMETAADYYDFEKFQAVLTSGIVDVGNGTAALINLLDTNNMECFDLINASDAESLAKYYHRENDEKPDGVSFEDYGNYCVKEEGGAFTEWGYIKLKYKELSAEYTGVVPDEYKITGMALYALRLSKPECGGKDEKPSVMAQIKAARQTPREPKDREKQKKDKGGPEL